MLTELLIRNLAVIDEVRVPFRRGFNVLTGETGAGKSIIIHALGLVTGAKAEADAIRAGAETLLVEATFDLRDCAAARRVAENLGFEIEDDQLVLARELSRSGRARCRIDGRTATLAMLREIGRTLVDIHGQHEHQSLAEPAAHVRFLDAAGETGPLRDRYAGLYRRLLEAERALEDLRRTERERIQRLDLLRYQAEEIDKADLRPGETDVLARERDLLANAERVKDHLVRALREIEGDAGAVEALGRALKALREIEHLDEAFRRRHEELAQALNAVQEVATALGGRAGDLQSDPERLATLQERLGHIQWLKRKYGDSEEAVLEHRRQIARELSEIESSGDRLAALEQERKALRGELAEAAEALSKARRRLARQLEKTVMSHLKVLVMEKAEFRVAFSRAPDPQGLALEGGPFRFGRDGVDDVEFLIAANPGEQPKPLAKIASGGELSRTMLALKASLQRAHEVPVLVFDEVDVGIGGRAAEAVGRKLRDVARYAQVLCVTHQAQIACLADAHLRVEKQDGGRETRVRVTVLEGDERVRELARTISGKEIIPSSLRHAQELLERGRNRSKIS